MATEQTLRTGVLFKKGSGQGPFGRRNWKPRYFVLTPRKLTYYTYEDGELKGEVDLSGCNEQSIEVMPADSMKTGSSASTIWRIAINGSDRRLIVAAGTEMEMNDWVEQFLVAFHINSGQPAPQRRSLMQAPASAPAHGTITNTHNMDGDYARNSITDFQNFASARRSVGGSVRASLGVHPGQEFRLSDEHERQKQAEQQRIEEHRQLAAMEAERLREEELLQAHLRSQAEERRKQKEALAAQQQQQLDTEKQREAEELRMKEQQLEEQRRLKREQHEHDRQEAERMLREMELQEEEQKHEEEIQHHFEEEHRVIEVHRRVVEPANPVPVAPPSPARSPVVTPPSPVRSPVVTPPSAPSPPPRSSLIGDAKKEAMMRQQAEHNKRREAAIKQQQEQMRQQFQSQQQRTPPHSPARSQQAAELERDASAQFKSATSVEF